MYIPLPSKFTYLPPFLSIKIPNHKAPPSLIHESATHMPLRGKEPLESHGVKFTSSSPPLPPHEINICSNPVIPLQVPQGNQ